MGSVAKEMVRREGRSVERPSKRGDWVAILFFCRLVTARSRLSDHSSDSEQHLDVGRCQL